MATLVCATMLVVVILAIVLHSEARPNYPTFIQSTTDYSASGNLSVFNQGKFTTNTIKLLKLDSSAPPVPMVIVSPNITGYYPVLFFIHGFGIGNEYYSELFHHIASHGIVVVSPEVNSAGSFLPISQLKEIEIAASAANWLPKKLQCVLPENVEVDLSRVAISGHGRGGKTAFSLALGKSKTTLTNLKFSALIGIDPVAGSSKDDRTKPHILTYQPNSFDLSIPVTIIGTGLGNHTLIPYIVQACAPNDVNHEEFFKECKEQCSYFVIADYGYSDIFPVQPFGMLCKSGNGVKDIMRRTLAGIVVAFLDAYFLDEPIQYIAILGNPSLAPTRLYPVENKGALPKPLFYPQI